jgi:hypothetical protein
VFKLIGVSNFELLNYLKIPEENSLYELEFEESKIWQDECLKKVNKLVKNKDFYVHRIFYEQMLLYSKV